VVTRRQLLEAGVAAGVIDRRLAAGRMRPLFRGVYLVGPLLPRRAREMAACLACGPGAVVSHGTAATLWGMVGGPRSRDIHVSVRERCPRRAGIITHRFATLQSDEMTIHDRVPITTPARTVYDLAGNEPARVLERAVSEAVASGLMTTDDVSGLVRRYVDRRGGHLLQEILGEDGPRFTRSEAEVHFLGLLERARLPGPMVNASVAGYEVDFYWPADRLVVEVDGFAYHASRQAFERDRSRDGDLSGAGLRVIRVTWRQLVDEPLAVVARLGACLTPAARTPGRRQRSSG
jgi:very-short-patch-repair endonuclease